MEHIADYLLQKQSKQKKTNINKQKVEQLADDIIALLYPQIHTGVISSRLKTMAKIEQTEKILEEILKTVKLEKGSLASKIAHGFISQLVPLSNKLDLDAKAIYQGDPAATKIDEVILSYPGFMAIVIHRISHYFYKQRVPLFPRILSEYAHRETGIDIHPGATIGDSFFIDHGTGIVIGETTHIGNNVKLYQGVTLGALSIDKSMANTKRHPTIEDNCIIYSNATILGGDTVIGNNTVVGGNVWLTESVAPNSMVYSVSETKVRSHVNSQ